MTVTLDESMLGGMPLLNNDDVPPASVSSDDAAPLRCEVCGVSLTYSGRGRRPKFCDEHRKTTTTSSGNRSTSLKALEASVADLYRGLGMGLSMVDAQSGFEVANAADKLAASWITLAETNPKVRKWLTKITTGSGTGAVIVAHATIAFPILQRHDLLPSFLSRNEHE